MIRLEAIGAGFARGTTSEAIEKLENDVEEVATKLAGNVNLFRHD